VANGVTTILSMFGSPKHLEWREEIRRVERRDTGVACQLSQWLDGDGVTTTLSTFAKPVTRRPIQLPGAQEITAGEYSLAMFDAGSVPNVAPGSIALPSSGPVPFGLSVTLLRTW